MEAAIESKNHRHGRRVGQLNGPWAFLFKVCMAMLPIFMGSVVPWATWITIRQFKDESFREESARLFVTQGEMEKRMADVPSPDWKARIIALEQSLQQITGQLGRIEAHLQDLIGDRERGSK